MVVKIGFFNKIFDFLIKYPVRFIGFKIQKNHELLSKNPMICYKKSLIWFFESIPDAAERESLRFSIFEFKKVPRLIHILSKLYIYYIKYLLAKNKSSNYRYPFYNGYPFKAKSFKIFKS